MFALRTDDAHAKFDAIGHSQAIIEFEPNGTIISANENFLTTMGYSLEEIRGQHHGIFVEPSYRESGEYRTFWNDLRNGNCQAAEFTRLAKGGREVWIQASYNPVRDRAGRVVKIVKLATDITAQKTEAWT